MSTRPVTSNPSVFCLFFNVFVPSWLLSSQAHVDQYSVAYSRVTLCTLLNAFYFPVNSLYLAPLHSQPHLFNSWILPGSACVLSLCTKLAQGRGCCSHKGHDFSFLSLRDPCFSLVSQIFRSVMCLSFSFLSSFLPSFVVSCRKINLVPVTLF